PETGSGKVTPPGHCDHNYRVIARKVAKNDGITTVGQALLRDDISIRRSLRAKRRNPVLKRVLL
ncbi:MAG TPA: hypothetical protein QGG35_07175, partial [Candidatus Marinimicrobia bacterium]|nr:hypothetical protein [Candidatus Neomarinimicrobiota bacterium]